MFIFNTGLGKVGLQVFVWKVIEQLINNNVRKKTLFHTLTTINLLLPTPVYYMLVYTFLCVCIYLIILMQKRSFVSLVSFFLIDEFSFFFFFLSPLPPP